MAKLIKPFYVDMTDTTNDQIRELNATCVKSGAALSRRGLVGSWIKFKLNFMFMGIDKDGYVLSHCRAALFLENPIKLEDVESFLKE